MRSEFFRSLLAVFLLVFTFLPVFVVPVSAHEVRPSIADFVVTGENRYEIRVLTNLEAMLSGIGSEHEDTDDAANANEYNALRLLEPDVLQRRFTAFKPRLKQLFKLQFGDKTTQWQNVRAEIPEIGDTDLARETILVFSGELPAEAVTMTWKWPEVFGPSVIRMEPAVAGEEGYSAYLSAGEASQPIELVGQKQGSLSEIIANYVVIGFTHILPKGLDHILFVVGLFLLSTKLSALLWQVTAFTLAHTVTLALGTLGYVSIPGSVVEPLIAASIAYVAIENIMTDKLHRWRPVIVFLFGLLHGLGFAGVLGEIGLSSTHFVAGLIAFNVGVELGQLAIIVICFLAVGYWFGDRLWYRRLIAVPASVFIAVIALWWVYERVFLA